MVLPILINKLKNDQRIICKLVCIDTLLVLILVDTVEDMVFPPSTSSSENALDIPESVDTESTAAVPENTFGFLVSALGW